MVPALRPDQMSVIDQALEQLSPREREVMKLALAGRTNDQIMKELGIARTTVGGLIHGARLRLGYSTRAQMIAQILQGRIEELEVELGYGRRHGS